MINTGLKIYQTLEQYDVNTGQATGITKPNTTGDPDYVAPVEDILMCPIPYMILTPNSIEIESGVRNFYVNVDSNVPWEAIPENSWLSIISTEESRFRVRATANDSELIRTGNIRVQGEGVYKFVGVNQEGNVPSEFRMEVLIHNITDTVCGITPDAVYYHDGTPDASSNGFTNATVLYDDDSGQSLAYFGFYSNGTVVREWNGTNFVGNSRMCLP